VTLTKALTTKDGKVNLSVIPLGRSLLPGRAARP